MCFSPSLCDTTNTQTRNERQNGNSPLARSLSLSRLPFSTPHPPLPPSFHTPIKKPFSLHSFRTIAFTHTHNMQKSRIILLLLLPLLLLLLLLFSLCPKTPPSHTLTHSLSLKKSSHLSLYSLHAFANSLSPTFGQAAPVISLLNSHIFSAFFASITCPANLPSNTVPPLPPAPRTCFVAGS